jgi:hypothetical protein
MLLGNCSIKSPGNVRPEEEDEATVWNNQMSGTKSLALVYYVRDKIIIVTL